MDIEWSCQSMIQATRTLFNSNPPRLGDVMGQPLDSVLRDVRCFKYADFDYAYKNCNNSYVRYVLDHMPIEGLHDRVLIDIKIHDLQAGDVACVPGWHLDGSINPHNLPKRPETFTLFVTGKHARTEFVEDPIILDTEESWNFAIKSQRCGRMIPESRSVITLPSCRFATYGDLDFHRGVPAAEPTKRLLVRTTETDIIKPRNRIYTPYTHSKS